MSIPDLHKGRIVYHATYINNLESIIRNGLLSTNRKNASGITHHNIAYADIQLRRSTMVVPVNPGGVVHDYVPFYFCPRDPMLLGQLNNKNIDQNCIVILGLDISTAPQGRTVFTDSAANSMTPPNFYTNPNDLSTLNWSIIDSNKWGYDDNQRPKKMSEFLIKDVVDFSNLAYLVTFNEHSKKEIEAILTSCQVTIPIRFGDYEHVVGGTSRKIHHYYTRFSIPNETNQTLVVGPKSLYDAFQSLVTEIPKHRKRKLSHSNIDVALSALNSNPSCLDELQKLSGLLPENPPHWEDALSHTLRVVELTRRNTLISPEDAKLLSLSAYLHDIGKANSPKSSSGKYLPDPNHSYRSISMLFRVFTEEINLFPRQLNTVCKLVVFHDLIGDIVGKHRNKDQLASIISNSQEFELLYLLTIADTESLRNPAAQGRLNMVASSLWV